MEKKLKILAVDDDFINLKLISSMLKRNDNVDTIVEATNGLDALNLLKTEVQIDLILLDIKMPVIDGYTAAQKIKEFSPKIPIIAQSAYALEHEREKFRDVFDDYLAKPINKEIFLMTLRKFMSIQNGY